jgi:hypothetical protein
VIEVREYFDVELSDLGMIFVPFEESRFPRVGANVSVGHDNVQAQNFECGFWIDVSQHRLSLQVKTERGELGRPQIDVHAKQVMGQNQCRNFTWLQVWLGLTVYRK